MRIYTDLKVQMKKKPKQPIIAFYFESENELKFHYLKALLLECKQMELALD